MSPHTPLMLATWSFGRPSIAAAWDHLAVNRMGKSYDLTDQDQVGVIVMGEDGHFSSGSLRAGFQVAIRTQQRDELSPPEVVLLGS